MKAHRVWWIVVALLLFAWAPFGLYELIHKLRGINGYPDEEVALLYGFWLFVWWPCHIIAALIISYKLVHWGLTVRRSSKA